MLSLPQREEGTRPRVHVTESVRRVEKPNHIAVVQLASGDVFGTDRRVLKFDHYPVIPNNIGAVKPSCYLNKLRHDEVLPPKVPWPDRF